MDSEIYMHEPVLPAELLQGSRLGEHQERRDTVCAVQGASSGGARMHLVLMPFREPFP